MSYKWILKAIVQKGISFLPFSQKWNFLFQKYVTKGVYLSDQYFADKIMHARDHIEAYRSRSGKAVPQLCLELGTGWYPVVPLYFFLSGTNRIATIDISKLTNVDRLRLTIETFREQLTKGGFSSPFDKFDPARVAFLQGLDVSRLTESEILSAIRLELHVKDARQSGFASDTFDLINSNNTFEHIYPSVLTGILREFVRVLKPDGVMSHFIDMSDHFAHFDNNITIYNFLRFEPWQWRIIDNSVQPQNRLRLKDYEGMYSQLAIPCQVINIRKGEPGVVKNLRLAKNYADVNPDDLAVSHCQLVS